MLYDNVFIGGSGKILMGIAMEADVHAVLLQIDDVLLAHK